MKNSENKKIRIKVVFCLVVIVFSILLIIINIYKQNQPKTLKIDIAYSNINETLKPYLGKQKGATVRSLLSTVEAYNETVENDLVAITYKDEKIEKKTERQEIKI